MAPTMASALTTAEGCGGVVVIRTLGSRWEFWETEHLYRRSPRTEGGREKPEWGGPEAGPLQDHVWHQFATWDVDDAFLWIEIPDGGFLRAPCPEAEPGTAHSCATCDE